jgi:broad specificity phosphatase PhoE
LSENQHENPGGIESVYVVERVILVRHGETDWSAQRLHTGRTDMPLNSEGERRSKKLADILGRYEGVATATVFTSPLQRARRTCELAGFGDRATVVDDLVEWDYGEFEGTRTADIRETDPAWSIWTTPIKQGETLEQVGARADRVVARLDDLDGVAILFSHAHILRILAARWCEFPPIGGTRFTMLAASVSVLGYEREVRVVEHWNAPCE